MHTLKGISLSEQCNLSVQRPLHVSPATTTRTTATRRSERRRHNNNNNNSEASSNEGSVSAHQQQEEDARIYVHISPCAAVYTVSTRKGGGGVGGGRGPADKCGKCADVCKRERGRGSERGSCPRAMLKNVINVFLSR